MTREDLCTKTSLTSSLTSGTSDTQTTTSLTTGGRRLTATTCVLRTTGFPHGMNGLTTFRGLMTEGMGLRRCCRAYRPICGRTSSRGRRGRAGGGRRRAGIGAGSETSVPVWGQTWRKKGGSLSSRTDTTTGIRISNDHGNKRTPPPITRGKSMGAKSGKSRLQRILTFPSVTGDSSLSQILLASLTSSRVRSHCMIYFLTRFC